MSELTNRMIAERAGWRVTWKPLGGGMRVRGLDHAWFVTPPDGDAERIDEDGEDVGGFFVSQAETEDEAWNRYTRDYLTSVDAALTLPLTHEYFWQLWGGDGNWECTVVRSNYMDQRLMVMDDTAPLAICRAWLKWREMMEDES